MGKKDSDKNKGKNKSKSKIEEKKSKNKMKIVKVFEKKMIKLKNYKKNILIIELMINSINILRMKLFKAFQI